MFEQALYKKILDIVEEYTKVSAERKSAYVDAAAKFRLPYWDYHRPRDYNAHFPGVFRKSTGEFRQGSTYFPYDFCVPQILTLDKVKVKMYPDDELKEIDNPLSRFSFPNGSLSDNDWKIAGYNDPKNPLRLSTARWSVLPKDFKSSAQALNGAINELREDYIRLSLNFVENGVYNKYPVYSTNGTSFKDPLDGKRASGSLESVHGAYHNLIGDLGHMSDVAMAAFDPIFWLHHNQIDRWFAIWQAAHPGEWFASPTSADPAKPDDPLLPFVRPDGPTEYWTSNQSVDTETFGYTYPDIDGIKSDPKAVQKRFKDLYSWARRLTNKADPNVKPPPEMEPIDLSALYFFEGVQGFKPLDKPTTTFSAVAAMAANVAQAPLNAVAASAPLDFAVKSKAVPDVVPAFVSKPEVEIVEDKVSREWYIDDVVQRLALNGSFSIIYMIGQFEHDASGPELILSPTFAGLNHIFTAPIEACDNCKDHDEQGHLVTATTPITSLLLDYVETGRLGSMRPEHVKPFLVKNLKWRVVKVDGTRVDPRVLRERKDFRISVSCKVAPLPGQEGTVVYETYPEISNDIIANAS
jgi:tyrosinase